MRESLPRFVKICKKIANCFIQFVQCGKSRCGAITAVHAGQELYGNGSDHALSRGLRTFVGVIACFSSLADGISMSKLRENETT